MTTPPRIRRIARRPAVAVCVAAVAAACAAAAVADYGSRQQASYTLTEKRRASSTAERFVFDYRNPADPQAKPPAVRRVVTVLPRRARYDATVPESCTASDTELALRGSEACPPGSAIGGGVVTVDTGAAGPGRFVTADVEFFNNADDRKGEFIYLNTVRGSGARTVIRADVTRRKTITDLAALPGTPPDGGAIDTVDLTVADVSAGDGAGARNYITTPPHCPRDRTWTTRLRFIYDDGERQVVATDSPCAGRGRAGR